jgi:hypothetical protein
MAVWGFVDDGGGLIDTLRDGRGKGNPAENGQTGQNPRPSMAFLQLRDGYSVVVV